MKQDPFVPKVGIFWCNNHVLLYIERFLRHNEIVLIATLTLSKKLMNSCAPIVCLPPKEQTPETEVRGTGYACSLLT